MIRSERPNRILQKAFLASFSCLLLLSFNASGQNRATIEVKSASKKDAGKSGPDSRVAYLKPRLESVLAHYFKQKERAEGRSPWGIMHAMIAFGPYAEMYAGGKLVKDVDWLCQNGLCRSWRLMRLENGKLATNNGPGRQGHDGQFLAILAQSQIPPDKELLVEGRRFTVKDLIRYEMDTCKPGEELTFKLIGLSHYLDSDQKWKSRDGRRWSLERIVEEELRQPINGVACGGTHRLMGHSYALLMRKLQDRKITGHWYRAESFINEYRDYAFSLQNPDGSFSTNWLKGREARQDPQRRIQTTGHILEWLIFSANEQEISDPRLIKAVDYLSNLLWEQRGTRWEVGPKGHAIRAVRLFYERVFVDPPTDLASKPVRRGNRVVDPGNSDISGKGIDAQPVQDAQLPKAGK